MNCITIEALLSNFALPLLVGSIAWFATNILLEPFLKFSKFRREILESIIYFANVPARGPAFDEARKTLRRLAAQLESLVSTLSPLRKKALYRYFEKCDPDNAFGALIALSNSSNDDQQMLHTHEVRKYLDLPLRVSETTYQFFLEREI